MLINAMFAGIGGLYVATHSISVTPVAQIGQWLPERAATRRLRLLGGDHPIDRWDPESTPATQRSDHLRPMPTPRLRRGVLGAVLRRAVVAADWASAAG